jgi:hypothetical protein
MRKSLKLEVVELNRYSIMLVVAAIMLSSIGLTAIAAAECCDIKCVWEPCGEKVEQGDVDAVYALKPIKAMWAYQDADSDGRFDDNDVLIIDTVLDQDAQGNWIGAWVIEEGDVRLSNYHETPANTKVISTDGDRGKPLKELPGGQMVVGFVDVNNNIPPHYDLGDPLYADTDGSSTVILNDVRLTERTVLIIDTVLDQDAQGNWIGAWVIEEGDVRLSNYHETPANTKVISTDGDRGKPLKELPGGQMVVGFVDVNNNIPPHYDLGDPLYADTDGSSTVTPNDVRLTERTVNIKTYPVYSRVQSDDWDVGNDLRDPVTYETDITTNSVTLLGYIDSDCNCHWTCPDKLYLQQITGTIADNFSTIGDLRLYIPPEAIADEDWPECGTKVEQCNKDAVYVLAKDDQIRIMCGDVNSNGRYDRGETVYVDMVDNGQDKVEAGDVRLTWYHDMYPPNTKVNSTNLDKNNPLEELCGGQVVVGFVDLNNNEVYNTYDPLYVDTDCNSRVSVGDVRLTKRMASGRTYEPYTVVKAGDYDLIGDKDLRDPVAPYGYGLVTPIWELLGYIDSDCSGDWTCPDKLYLQQITGTIADDVVTIGDLRLYIPPEEIQPDDNDDFDPMVYDTDSSGEIDKSEVFAAIADYFDNNITKEEVFAVIAEYFS